MVYVRNPLWKDGQNGGTPLTADALNHIEDGLVTAAGAVDAPRAIASITGLQGVLDNKVNVGDIDIADVNGLTAALATKADASSILAGTTLTVQKNGTVWPARPTARTDVTVIWKGAEPSPPIVASGTGGMLDNVDSRWITP